MPLTSLTDINLDADQFGVGVPEVVATITMTFRSQQLLRKTIRIGACVPITGLLLSLMSGGLANDIQSGGGPDARIERLLQAKHALEGRRDYAAYCESCHGEQGQGAGGIAAFTDGTVDAQRIRDAISGGHEAKIASAWQSVLDAVRVAGVADYILQAFAQPSEPIDRSAGESIYAKTCSVCHGEQGDGASWAHRSLDPPPIDFTSAEAREMSRRQMIVAASYGVDGTAMMPFSSQLSPTEIAAVIDYIRVVFVKSDDSVAAAAKSQPENERDEHDHAMPADGDMEAPFPNAIIGDYQRGKAFYEANCAECHGIDGEGDGRRAYFITPKPRNFTTDRSRSELNRPHLFGAISDGVIGREMPAWSKVIDDQQIADVAEYVFERFVRPERGAAAPSWEPAPADGGAKKN